MLFIRILTQSIWKNNFKKDGENVITNRHSLRVTVKREDLKSF